MTTVLTAASVAVMACSGGQLKTKAASDAKFSAEKIYQEWGCGTCHGENGAGSSQGPSLLGLAAYWRRNTLIRYLKDPASARASEARLQQLSRRYYPISMPAFDGLDSTQIGMLADHLLQQQ
ncbi:MAG: cytochrome c [candidate division KSB1 bacterium]|nr:cytochrome c [candidate division KSB1 bacterium]MDZ7313139.1 cytochrome c [candidate division KSB1 bacterium]